MTHGKPKDRSKISFKYKGHVDSIDVQPPSSKVTFTTENMGKFKTNHFSCNFSIEIKKIRERGPIPENLVSSNYQRRLFLRHGRISRVPSIPSDPHH